MTDINDIPAMAQRLRDWVHARYGKWITHATALRALRFILRGQKP